MSTTGPGSNLHVEPIATRGEGPARCVFQQQEEHTRAGLPPCPLLLASLVSNFGHAHEQYMSSSILTPLRSTLHTLVKACGRLVGAANLHLSEVGHAALATFARTFGCNELVCRAPRFFPAAHGISHTFCLVHVLPAVCAAQHVFCALCLHVLALVVATIEDHLVWTRPAFEAVFASMCLV
jgi:hypothetical protein